MIKKLLIILRDPLWTGIAGLVCIITLLLSLRGIEERNELSIVHWKSIAFNNFWLSEQVKLDVENLKIDINNVQVDYFQIINLSRKPILSSDYETPLTLEKGNNIKRIIRVDSCSEKYSEVCSESSTKDTSEAWNINGQGKWSMVPALLNPNDNSCVMVVSEKDTKEKDYDNDSFVWNARIVNIDLKIYSSFDDFYKKTQNNFYNYFMAGVNLEGLEVYLFILIYLILFGYTLFLANQADWIITLRLNDIFRISFISALSLSTSEILVFLLYKKENMDPICWPLLGIHLIVLIGFFYFINHKYYVNNRS